MDPQSRFVISADLRATAAAEDWTPWQLVQAIHGKAETRSLLMAWRLAAGQTQAEVIAGVRGLAADDGHPCSRGNPSIQHYSRWENGHGTPSRFYRRYLALWFRCPLDRLGLADEDPIVTLMGQAPDPELEDDVDRRRFFSVVAAAPMIWSLDSTRSRMEAGLRRVLPAQDLDHWADVTAGHVASYGTVPPQGLLDALSPDLHEIAGFADRYPHQRELHLIASRLCGLVGAAATDLEQERTARDWLHTARRYADLSGDTTQRYWIAMAQAISAYYGPTPQMVITIVGRARAMLGDAPSAPAAQLTGLAARAYARLGQREEAARELANAHATFDRLTAEQRTEPFFGFPQAEMTMYSSQVLSLTGKPEAWNEQDKALAAYPDDDPMDRPLILLDRARYLIGQGEAGQAAAVAAAAVTEVPAHRRVPLLMTQARQLGDALAQLSPQAAANLREAALI
ncbi:hypothetical protein Misp01_06950 [Microtetraspora sp. NBRC 13810]|uniref:hypothetical protein n=1 Tax=Microtetraspora sp. NBRC 13810 TaxID=3030990 RepID=UPI0024A34836|nr:hypothetical protein [Microtetraspora sp. NBRC 13810]GLW05565.1 hypothetical protein Misp01_06950 [Microtetraspora sp. NBRC 13810]